MTTWVPHGMLRFASSWLQFIAEIGVAGDDHVARGDRAARGADHRRAGVLDAGDRRLLIHPAAIQANGASASPMARFSG